MILATQSDLLSKLYGDFEAVRMLKEADFDGIDYSMFPLTAGPHPLLEDDWKEKALALRVYADSLNIPFVQGHAPFSFKDRTPEGWRTHNYFRTVRAIEVAGVQRRRALWAFSASTSGRSIYVPFGFTTVEAVLQATTCRWQFFRNTSMPSLTFLTISPQLFVPRGLFKVSARKKKLQFSKFFFNIARVVKPPIPLS